MTLLRAKFRPIPLLITLLLLASCSQRSGDDERPLARVEDRSLTLSDLKEESDLVYFSLGETAERWIDEQVLLHHVDRSDIIDQYQLAARLEEYESRLLSGLLLDSLLHREIRIDPERIREYYVNNLETFQFQDSAAAVVHLGFLDLDSAIAALGILEEHSAMRDSVLGQYNYDRQVVYRRRTIPVLDQTIFTAEAGQFYGPLTTDFGYHLILVENFYRPGETIPFSLVRKQIFEHLFNERLPLARSTIIDSLRETIDIEVYQ